MTIQERCFGDAFWCCCGCGPWYLLVKGAITLPLFIVVDSILSILIVLLFLQLWAVRFIIACVVTPRFNWELKLIALLIGFPSLYVLSTVLSIAFAPLVWFGLTAYFDLAESVRGEHSWRFWLPNFDSLAKGSYEFLKKLVEFCKKNHFKSFAKPKGAYTKFSGGFIIVVPAILFALLNGILATCVAIVLAAIFTIPLMILIPFRILQVFFFHVKEEPCVFGFFPFVLVGFLISIPLVPFCTGLGPIIAFFYGLWGFTAPYRFKFSQLGKVMARHLARLLKPYNFACDFAFDSQRLDDAFESIIEKEYDIILSNRFRERVQPAALPA